MRHVRTLRWQVSRVRSALLRPRVVLQDHPVVVDEADRCRQPIFLIGVHRSGTSLVRRMFNAHPNIACPPETFFLRHYAAMVRDHETFDGYAGLGFPAEEALAEIGRCAARAHELFRRSQGKPRWADKTPDNIDVLDELRLLFPDARFVMIYRDPFDVAFSIHRWGWFVERFTVADAFEGTLRHVCTMLDRQRAFEAANPASCTRLSYSDLVRDVRATLEPVLAFLGEPWSDEMEHFHRHRHNRGAEDLMVQASHGIVPSVGNWADWSARRQALAQDILGAHRAGLGFG